MQNQAPDEKLEAVIQQQKAVTAAGETVHQWRKRKDDESREAKRSARFSYTARLAGAFALVAAMTALIAATILAFVWEGNFDSYTRDNMNNLASQMALQVEKGYAEADGFSDTVIASVATTSSMYPDIAVQVTDIDGVPVYDDSWANSNVDALAGVSSAPTAADKMVSSSVWVDGKQVGTVRLWAHSSNALLTQKDIAFKASSYSALILAAIIAVLLAIVVGVLFAKGLVIPIRKVTATARRVKGGDLSARTGMSGFDEIDELGETFDEMADSIQRDRELERRLTTDVAHELRTPLMGIQATVEAIMDGVFPADDERLAAINSETMRLKRLVDALLNLSKLESGSMPFHETRIDLVELIAGLCMSHEALLEAAELTLSYESDDSVLVDGDADMLRQATANLISNAVRYNEPGGTVVVGVHKRDGFAAISVNDSGMGISDEDKRMIFNRFWRADAGRNRASGGLGVGLAVVKEIVDYHKGRIEVQSEVGKGTTFTLFIPLAHEESVSKGRGGRSGKQVKIARGKTGKQNRVAGEDGQADKGTRVKNPVGEAIKGITAPFLDKKDE